MLLAKDGLPSGGSIGYEIFDRGDAMTASDFQQQINQTRALEGICAINSFMKSSVVGLELDDDVDEVVEAELRLAAVAAVRDDKLLMDATSKSMVYAITSTNALTFATRT